ncbi:MAG: helix-turn-helix transcriptional regulator [Clostridia bacterium]|nr:helix-turn-helix transcriptional regulator [Clostridia bacterium]
MTNDVKVVAAAQRYIKEHHCDDDFCADKVCENVGYSRRQLDRFFHKHLHISLSDYLRAVVLSESARELAATDKAVIDIALESHYQSHSGFTRSFSKLFSVTPDEYRKSMIAIPIFTQYPINHYYILKEGKTVEQTAICTVTAIDRPKRKLIYLTSESADGYMSYCEEVGCEWEGLLNSIPEKFETAALIELPDFLVEEGISRTASGVEVPEDYCKPLPEGYRQAELPPCTMLFFESEPFENPEDFGEYIGQVFAAIEKYDLRRHGYELAREDAPSYNFGASHEIGARAAIPVRKI